MKIYVINLLIIVHLSKETIVKNVNKDILKLVETAIKKLKIVECNIKMNVKIVLNHSIYFIIIANPLFKIANF